MPAFGLSAVPLPTKNRSRPPTPTVAVADALGVATCAAAPVTLTAGSPVLTTAAGIEARDAAPDSRRAPVNAVHANGAAAGESPDVLPAPSHPATLAPTPSTPPAVAARRAAVIPGADSAAATGGDDDDLPAAEPPTEPATRPECDPARWGADFVVEPAVELDPAEPVVSANATGIDATADPTPNATANAPTRPT